MPVPAEIAYLFRHAVIRDAAYDLLPPTTRGALHLTALEIMEALVATQPPDQRDAWGEELADHALQACDGDGADRAALRLRELQHLLRGAQHESRHWHNERAIQLRKRIAEHPNADPTQRFTALLDAVETLMRSGGPNRAAPLLEAATEVAEETGEISMIAQAAAARAQAAFLTGRASDAEKLNAEALKLAREAADTTLEARVLISMSGVAQGTGNWEQGERAARQAWELLEPQGSLSSLARSRLYMGDSCWQQGKLAEAEGHFRAALQVYGDGNNIAGEASARDHLGSLLMELGRAGEARLEHERAAEIYAAVGDPVGHGSALSNLATVLMEEGNIRDAYVHRALALKNFRNAGATYMEGVGLGNLASLERHLGLLERASQSFQRARDILRRGGRVVEQAVFESSFGQLLLLLGFHDAARVNAQQASDDLMRVGAVNWCAQYATLLEIRLDVDRAAKGSATAVRDARQRLENMRALLTDMPGAEGTGLGRAAAKGNELLQEAQQPEPLLFRGHLVSELEAPLRLALMDRMRRIEPEQWQALQNQPRLLKAFREGTEGLETPDWESTES